jgi:hypothetical protein
LGDGFHGPVLMYYLLMLLVCSYRATKTQNPAGQPALKASDILLGSGFQSLIFKSENGFGFRSIAP